MHHARPHLLERHGVLIHAHPVAVGFDLAGRDVVIAVTRFVDVDLGCAVARIEIGAIADAIVVQEGDMGGVEPAFEPLQVIARLIGFRDRAMRFRHARPFVIGRGRHCGFRAEIGPDDAAALDRRIGFDRDARFHRACCRLRRQVDAFAVGVEFPAVIDAAEAAFLVAAKEQRRAAMRAIRVDQTDSSLRVAESDQVLAEQPHAHRRAVFLGQFGGQRRRLPIAAEQLASRRAGTHPDEALLIFSPHPSHSIAEMSLDTRARLWPGPIAYQTSRSQYGGVEKVARKCSISARTLAETRRSLG